MSTTITGVMARDRAPDMFADLTTAAYTYTRANGLSTLVFDADLDAATVESIWWRMTSRDDADETTRRSIHTLLTSDDPGLCQALARAYLGIT